MDEEAILEVNPAAPAAVTRSGNKPPGRALPTCLTHRIVNKTQCLFQATKLSDTGLPGFVAPTPQVLCGLHMKGKTLQQQKAPNSLYHDTTS